MDLFQALGEWQAITGVDGGNLNSIQARSFFEDVDWSHVVGWPQHLAPPRGYDMILKYKCQHPHKMIAYRSKDTQSMAFVGCDSVVASELLSSKLGNSADKCAPGQALLNQSVYIVRSRIRDSQALITQRCIVLHCCSAQRMCPSALACNLSRRCSFDYGVSTVVSLYVGRCSISIGSQHLILFACLCKSQVMPCGVTWSKCTGVRGRNCAQFTLYRRVR